MNAYGRAPNGSAFGANRLPRPEWASDANPGPDSGIFAILTASEWHTLNASPAWKVEMLRSGRVLVEQPAAVTT